MSNEFANKDVLCVDPRPWIAILIGAPLNAQNVERTGIPYISPYAQIVVFDCKPWLGRLDTGTHHESANWDHVENINSAEALEQALRRYQPAYALDFIGLHALTPVLQILLAASGTRFVVQKSGNLPVPSRWSRLTWKLNYLRQQSSGMTLVSPAGSSPSANKMWSRLVSRVLSYLNLRRSLREPDLALLAGRASLNHFTVRSRHILWVGSQDYHIYRGEVASQDCQLEGHYALFIDDNLPYASDWSLLGLSPPVTADRYYPAMRRMLAAVEAAWGMPVVVAAHPSSRRDERVQEGFGDRKLLHDQTAGLVRNAQAVLLHNSTAVSFAVIANKPMVFLSTNELLLSKSGLNVKTMAAELGHTPINIDKSQKIPALHNLAPNKQRYDRYIDRYILKRGSSESQPWQAFIDFITAQAVMKFPKKSDHDAE